MGSAFQRVAVAMKLLTPLKGFKQLQLQFVCLQTQCFLVRWNHRPGAFLAFQEGFGFLKYLFLVFFAPGLVKVLERSGPKDHFVKIQPPMDLFFLCTVSPKRKAHAFFWSSNFRRFETCCHFFLRNLTCIPINEDQEKVFPFMAILGIQHLKIEGCINIFRYICTHGHTP